MPRGVIADPPASPGYIIRVGALRNYKGLQQLIDDGIIIEFTQKSESKLPSGTVVNVTQDDKGRIFFEELSRPETIGKKRVIIKRERGDFTKRVPKSKA